MQNIFTELETQTAFSLIENTSKNLFLTGKAGTGKTTFLQKLLLHTTKKTVVAAPTGVAAINAKGTTLHSLLQLPIGCYVPERQDYSQSNAVTDPLTLKRNLRFSSEKIELLNTIELLIIDEVSMLRCDMLDAADEILKHIRRNPNEPFGGLQILFIGDLLQLPPVLPDSELSMINLYYDSPYFFSARALRDDPLIKIELKTIYRQTDKLFIKTLNNIRNNTPNDQDFELLQEIYRPLDEYEKVEGIIISTHNKTVDRINSQELEKLETQLFTFKGELKGEFNEKNCPTDIELLLKVGAQVMFVKNDAKPEKRYYNGKLATITHLTTDKITLKTIEDKLEFELEKEVWKTTRYKLNPTDNNIEEEELGRFTQYPIRLAWAVTIHKSQGLTFDKVVIDAGQSFATGQVYVALSRCRTLAGIRLLSPIRAESIKSDSRIIKYYQEADNIEAIKLLIEDETPLYQAKQIKKHFNLQKQKSNISAFINFTREKSFTGIDETLTTLIKIYEQLQAEQKVAEKFDSVLNAALVSERKPTEKTADLLKRAIVYFVDKLSNEVLIPLHQIRNKIVVQKKVTQFIAKLDLLIAEVANKINTLQKIRYFNEPIIKEPKLVTYLTKKQDKEINKSENSTFNISLELYNEHKSIEKVAELRNLSITTIEGHLAKFVESGELDVFNFINESEIAVIKKVALAQGVDKLTPIKEKLGDEYSYGQIKMGISYLKFKKEI